MLVSPRTHGAWHRSCPILGPSRTSLTYVSPCSCHRQSLASRATVRGATALINEDPVLKKNKGVLSTARTLSDEYKERACLTTTTQRHRSKVCTNRCSAGRTARTFHAFLTVIVTEGLMTRDSLLFPLLLGLATTCVEATSYSDCSSYYASISKKSVDSARQWCSQGHETLRL